MVGVGDKLKITKVETRLIKPRWLLLKSLCQDPVSLGV